MAGNAPTIKRLSQEVVNRIAAGEVVHRPANAIKEMLENSLDAGSKSITITVKGGGLKFLQIQDDGHGIRQEDMGIVCERFTTSKLREFGDLESIQTYGFRGEALASISHVARLSITTMTRDSPCAFKASYSDGKPVPAVAGGSCEPEPCAGVPGTQITVEDVFYNMPTRRKAFRSPSEEYNRILDVVTRYAVHCGDRGVAFTCRKHGSASPDVHSPASSDRRAVVRHLYGAALAKELLNVSGGPGLEAAGGGSEVATGAPVAASSSSSSSGADDGGAARFTFNGLLSNANYSMKRRVFILFINGRLVECPSIRKSVEAVFAEYLPKGTHPWVYLRLDMPGDAIDVNVHPTKREVHFLHEDRVVDAVAVAVAERLLDANSSRAYFAQTLLPGASAASVAPEEASAPRSGRNAQAPRSSLAGADAIGRSPGDEDSEDDAELRDVGAGTTPSAARRRSAGERRRGSGAADAEEDEEAEAEDTAPRRKLRRAPTVPPSSSGRAPKAAGYPSKTVRTDSTAQTLTRFLERAPRPPAGALDDALAAATAGGSAAPPASRAGEASGGSRGAASRQRRDAELAELTATAMLVDGAGRAGDDACCDDAGGAEGAAEVDLNATADVAGAKRPKLGPGPGAGVGRQPRAGASAGSSDRSSRRPGFSPVRLTSVRELRAESERAAHPGLSSAVRKHTFVGVVDEELSLVQVGTKLLLANHLSFARELMYQQSLRLFAGMRSFELRPAPPLRDLVAMALEGPDGEGMDAAAKAEAAAAVAALLASKAEMLREYFGVAVEPGAEGQEDEPVLAALPRLVDGHTPCLDFLPDFALALAYDVDWDDEKACFQTIAAVLAELYARVPRIPRFSEEPFVRPPRLPSSSSSSSSSSSEQDVVAAATAALRAEDAELIKLRREPGSALWVVEQVLWPAFRFGLTPSRALADEHNVIQIACTEQLYKVFERC